MTDITYLGRGTGMTSGEKALTLGQVEKLLKAIDYVPDYALFTLAITTGIRREDIVNIQRQDVNLEDGSLAFYEEKKNRTRTIYLQDKAIQALRLHLNSVSKHGSEWLFPSTYKTEGKYNHITGRHIYRRFNDYLNKAGLPARPFHALRATCYKLLQAKGWKAEDAARYIGDSVKVAMEHYGTPSTEEIRAMVREKPIL